MTTDYAPEQHAEMRRLIADCTPQTEWLRIFAVTDVQSELLHTILSAKCVPKEHAEQVAVCAVLKPLLSDMALYYDLSVSFAMASEDEDSWQPFCHFDVQMLVSEDQVYLKVPVKSGSLDLGVLVFNLEFSANVLSAKLCRLECNVTTELLGHAWFVARKEVSLTGCMQDIRLDITNITNRED